MDTLMEDVLVVKNIVRDGGVHRVLTCLEDVLLEQWNDTTRPDTMSRIQTQLEVIRQAKERI